MAAFTAIDDPSAHFKVQLYSGNGAANHAITFDDTDTNMQPDLVWIKNRDTTDGHCWFDAIRGATKLLDSDTTAAEATDTDTLDSFASDGFQVDADVKVNTDGEAYVAWCWKANGAGSSNTDGTTNTGATSANATAGFSILTYTGTGSAATIGHGLGAVPTFILVKKRSGTSTWLLYSVHNGNDKAMYMDRNSASSNATLEWASTTPSSTVFSIGDNGDASTSDATFVGYIFTDIQGFSKFGQYEGNANADGTFVYTGFRPAFVLIKKTNGDEEYYIWDNKREGFNHQNDRLQASTTTAEYAEDNVDLLSNGFKCRANSARFNGSGGEYIYVAFAEAPLVNSNGVPGNAR